MDWVPGHFPKDDVRARAVRRRGALRAPRSARGEHQDWGTYIFDYGRNEVRNFLVANALYWFEEFHVDGLRVDAVASMLYLDYSREEGEWAPNIHGGRENLEAIRFLQEVNATAYKRYPGIAMIAEESTSFPGVTAPTSQAGLGFGFKWNMGWMNDSLQYIKRDPMYRSHHEGELSFSFVYAFSENYVLPISHDEVVHGKGSLFAPDAGRPLAEARQHAGVPGVHVGPPGQAAAVHGPGVRSDLGVVRRALARLVAARPAVARAAAGIRRAPSTASTATHSALWARDSDGAAFSRLGAPDVESRTSSPSRVATGTATPSW